jgi:hypothetical protein
MSRAKTLVLRFGIGLFVSALAWGEGTGGSLAWAQTPAGTAFSYQGRLTDGGAPASGVYDLRFTLFDAATGNGTIGTPVDLEDVSVTSGLFTVMLDFGSAAFAGDARWLEISIRPGVSTDAFTPLASRQMLTPSPHAIFSQRSLHSATSDSSVASQSSVTSQSSDATPWTGITGKPAGFADDVDDDTLTTLSCSTAGHVAKWTGSAWSCAADADATGLDWKLAGNAGTGGLAVLGTLDNQPFALQVNGNPALRFVPDVTPRIVGGHVSNNANAVGATIAGGGAVSLPNVTTGPYATISGGLDNEAGNEAVVAGGRDNIASGTNTAIAGGAQNRATSSHATVGGGFGNTASGVLSVIGGGSGNVAGGDSVVIGGGEFNEARGFYATVGGGRTNHTNGAYPTIGGGINNQATGFAATVPGGNGNVAGGAYSFAAGFGASAGHDGSFVWGDFGAGSIFSTALNQFIVRASGGIWFGTNNTPDLSLGFINTSTGAYLSNGGTWTNASDRNLKERFQPVDGARLLDQLARLPIATWSYKTTPAVRHIGPMAQDFHAIFGFGGDDKAISTIDPAGIALGAIQELHRQLDAQRTALNAQRTELDDARAQAAAAGQKADALAAQVAALQTIVRQLQQSASSSSTTRAR